MIKSSDLSWIVVSDLKKAKEFFIETLGMKMLNNAEEFGWAEVGGAEGGATLGLAEDSPMMEEPKAGGNAVITLTVDNVEKTTQVFEEKGIELVGEVMEVPGHVKLQMFKDPDGNLLQIVEKLD